MNTAKLLSVAEHAHYPFKSYPRKECKTLLFPGCSFPSQLPQTMDALALLCRAAGIGIAYDCCGSPLAGFGEQKAAERVLRNLRRRFAQLKCERIVLVCPNCKQHLADKLECEIVDIFTLFGELGIDCAGTFSSGRLFIPCPDKKQRATENNLRSLYDLSNIETLNHAPCCGLRPDLASKGSGYSAKLGKKVIDQAENERIYTYCASCLGQFTRLGCSNCRHAVSVVLGIDEQPDAQHALANRAKRKFDRNTDPLPTMGG